MAQSDSYALELSGIDKRFGEVHANKHIDLQVCKGSIHGIVGENGAGKSTLMSIIYGFYHADSGEMKVALALYPVSMKQLMDIADSGNIMPPKTTWFEPKLRSGLVIHKLDE